MDREYYEQHRAEILERRKARRRALNPRPREKKPEPELSAHGSARSEARSLTALLRKESVEQIRELISIPAQVEELLPNFMVTYRKQVLDEFNRLVESGDFSLRVRRQGHGWNKRSLEEGTL
jgi:hypothetical protein